MISRNFFFFEDIRTWSFWRSLHIYIYMYIRARLFIERQKRTSLRAARSRYISITGVSHRRRRHRGARLNGNTTYSRNWRTWRVAFSIIIINNRFITLECGRKNFTPPHFLPRWARRNTLLTIVLAHFFFALAIVR